MSDANTSAATWAWLPDEPALTMAGHTAVAVDRGPPSGGQGPAREPVRFYGTLVRVPPDPGDQIPSETGPNLSETGHKLSETGQRGWPGIDTCLVYARKPPASMAEARSIARRCARPASASPKAWGNLSKRASAFRRNPALGKHLVGIKNHPGGGENAWDNLLATGIAGADGHPVLLLGGRAVEHGREVNERLCRALAEADPERFGTLPEDLGLLLGDHGVQDPWVDPVEFLVHLPLRQFVRQHPMASTSLFGAAVAGDAEARGLTRQLLASGSTRQIARAWLAVKPATGEGVPLWRNGIPAAPFEAAGRAERTLLPVVAELGAHLARRADLTGPAIKRLGACRKAGGNADAAARRLPQLVLAARSAEDVPLLENAIEAGLLAEVRRKDLPKRAAALGEAISKLDAESRAELGADGFAAGLRLHREKTAEALSELLAFRIGRLAEKHRPEFLCKRLDPEEPGNLAKIARELNRRIAEQLEKLPLGAQLKMMRQAAAFDAAGGAGGRVQMEQGLSAFAVAAAHYADPPVGPARRVGGDRWPALLSRAGREDLARELQQLGKAKELLTPAELATEGKEMSHCVGGYSHQCRRGDASIWSLTDRNGERSTLTLSIGGGTQTTGAILQNKAKINFPPSEGCKRMARALSAFLRDRLADEAAQRVAAAERRSRQTLVTTQVMDGRPIKVVTPEGRHALAAVQASAFTRNDPQGAGCLVSESALLSRVPLPEEGLTLDIERRLAAGGAQGRSTVASGPEAVAEQVLSRHPRQWNFLHRRRVDPADTALMAEQRYDLLRASLPDRLKMPDLLAAVHRLAGPPVGGAPDREAALKRSRATREFRRQRLVELMEPGRQQRLDAPEAEPREPDPPEGAEPPMEAAA